MRQAELAPQNSPSTPNKTSENEAQSWHEPGWPFYSPMGTCIVTRSEGEAPMLITGAPTAIPRTSDMADTIEERNRVTMWANVLRQDPPQLLVTAASIPGKTRIIDWKPRILRPKSRIWNLNFGFYTHKIPDYPKNHGCKIRGWNLLQLLVGKSLVLLDSILQSRDDTIIPRATKTPLVRVLFPRPLSSVPRCSVLAGDAWVAVEDPWQELGNLAPMTFHSNRTIPRFVIRA